MGHQGLERSVSKAFPCTSKIGNGVGWDGMG